MSSVVLFIAFGSALLTSIALLLASGVGKELFGRFQVRNGEKPALAEASSDWIENHDFWDLGEIEEVAF